MEASGCRIIEYPDKNAEFSIYDVADQHLLNRGSSMSHILKDRDRIAEDDYALWFEGGDYCLPESAEVLTKRGFVKGIDLASTDMVLGYEHGKTRWVKVNNKFIIKNAELISFGSYNFAATCTENHRWLCRSGRGKESYCTLNEINTGQGIVVSAPCVEDGDINITPTEASLLGWLITDGCVRTLSKNSFNAGIAQSPRKYLDVIKKEFKELITGEYSVANSDCSQINLATKKVRELFDKIGICHETIKDDLLKIVARFPQQSRKAMLDSMLKAGGWAEQATIKNYLRKPRLRFSQKRGAVLDIFCVLATMEGLRLGKFIEAKNGVVTVSISHSKLARKQSLRKKGETTQGVAWCIKTETGNFVCRIGDQITITGNCDFIYPGDKRFDAQSFDPDVSVNDLAELANLALIHYCAIYLPIAHKCLGILLGNHEQKALTHKSQMFIHSALCDKMNAPNMRYSGFTDLYFVHKPNRRKVNLCISYTPPEKFTAKLRVFIHHGMGAANTAGGKINKLKSLVDMVDADLVMMSHVHEQFAKAFLKLQPNHNCTEIGQKVTMGLITGSYLKTYAEGFTGYGEIAGYSPTTLGATRARYKPSEMTLIVENRGDNVGVKGV